MDLRFLALVESDAPGFPFVPGQVLTNVGTLSPRFRQLIRDGLAELVREDVPEMAVAVAVPERAVQRRGKR
jgi:hypothetical protein